jgi:hypothetical protein
VPRARQAPDGGKSGGYEPMDISRINRRIDWLRLFQCTKVKNPHENLKKLRPTLDLGSHINAGTQPHRGVDAQRTLPGVCCSALFGPHSGMGSAHGCAPSLNVLGATDSASRVQDDCAQRITSSASMRRVGGIVIPSAWAVRRLMTSSKRVGCSTGKSAGLAPFRILSTYVAARRHTSGRLAP